MEGIKEQQEEQIFPTKM